jgi:hypothetical protein
MGRVGRIFTIIKVKNLSFSFFHLPYLPLFLEFSNPNSPCLKTAVVATVIVVVHTSLITGAPLVHGQRTSLEGSKQQGEGCGQGLGESSRGD